MNEIDVVLLSVALGVAIGAVAWERLRVDRMPRLWNCRNVQPLRELSARLARQEGQVSGA